MTSEWNQRALASGSDRSRRRDVQSLHRWPVVILLLGWTAFSAWGGSASAASREQLAFFEQKIRPVLVEHCYSCHSEQAEKTGQLKGGLRLDTRAATLQGGDSGPAVVPGDAENSLILSALKYDSFEMPPKGRLPDAVIADFQTWIQDGAIDPRTGSATKRAEIDIAAGREHWSYQLPRRANLPAVVDRAWPLGSVDTFLLNALEAKSLSPVGDASRAALARRLSYDLRGLPPDDETIRKTVTQLDRVTRRGTRTTFFRLGDDPGLRRFLDGLADRIGGRVIAPDLGDLGAAVVGEYLRFRRAGHDDLDWEA